MSSAASVADTVAGHGMRPMLEQLQQETILLTLPALPLAGLILIVYENRFREPLQATVAAVILLVAPVVVWSLREHHYAAAAWALVGTISAVALLLAVWAGTLAPLYLLSLAAGIAALFVGISGGMLAALTFTLPLAFAPPTILPSDPAQRVAILIGIWGTVGLIWLSTRPVLTLLEWSWSGYERSRDLLEQARDYQVQLKQTLSDLADANLQLTRLNRLAQGLRQAAEEARLAKEQFVANVSHELRTPLNMIVGFSEMILQAPKTYGRQLPAALLADLAVIARNSQHLSSLIDDVLDLSQIEAGQMALTRERVALREIAEAAVIAVRPLYESKGLYLDTEVPEDLAVFCDRTRIREVLLNLLSNAGRFTEEGGVRVRAWREGSDCAISVADTGPGIASEDQSKLFQPFQQLDSSLRRRYGGTGLGLAISKSFVEMHGGRMWVESKEGSGTTFLFRLPIDAALLQATSVSRWFSPEWRYEQRTHRSLAPVPIVRPRYVVLESGNSLRRLLARYVDGIELVAVANLEEAAQQLASVPAQALLINEASTSNSLQGIKEASTLPYGTPVIVCSLPELGDTVDALGVDDYLVKPISREALLAALGKLNLSGRTVLVVDDEPEALQLFWRMLASAEPSYRVLRASDGRQAMALLRQERPDAMLLDLVMPEMDGFRVLEARSQDPALRSIPAVVISARDPAGQPIVSGGLAVTRGGGLSVAQLLSCIEAMTAILGTAGQNSGPESRGGQPG